MENSYNFTFPYFSNKNFEFNYDSEYELFNQWNSEDSYSLNNLTKSLHYDKGSTFGDEYSVDVASSHSSYGSVSGLKVQEESPVKEDNLENKVKQEIDEMGIMFALGQCLKQKSAEKKKPQKKLRNKQTKTKEQVERLELELKKNPGRWSKQQRIKIAEEIGLTQIQVYKWYYDNTNTANNAKLDRSEIEYPKELAKRQKTHE